MFSRNSGNPRPKPQPQPEPVPTGSNCAHIGCP